MLSTTSANSYPLPLSRQNGPASSADLGDTTSSFDFLPSVSFDDLQSSLESASTDYNLAQFPAPRGQGTILDPNDTTMATANSQERPNVTQNGGTTRVVIPQSSATRPARSGSLLRRPSLSGKPLTALTPASRPPSSGVSDAPTAPAAMRPRRQNHYPPVSNSNIAKPPRKSTGPGLSDADYGARFAHQRRTSLASNGDRAAADTTRSSIDLGPSTAGASSSLTAATRASKARSYQPGPRQSYNSNNTTITSDHLRTPSIASRSPRVPSKGATGFPNKRLSGMHAVPSPPHISGLGARTISPTDTRRMKRLSLHHQSHNANQPGGATQQPAEHRSSSRSPSMIPRKASATPSSSRTTPDANRKSYSSGLSVNSVNSYNTVRTSTGSLQPRFPQSMSSSRLPAPKPLNTNQSHPGENDEDVPPVPAIPKAYESPKDVSMEAPHIGKRKLFFPNDSGSTANNPTGTITLPPPPDYNGGMRRKASIPKSSFQTQQQDVDTPSKPGTTSQSRRNLQPLHLPPMTVGPLGAPTTAKIAALQQKQDQADLNVSPPPSKMIPRTPTTPMTASKTTFFSRNRPEKVDFPSMRSTSSIQPTRLDSPEKPDPSSSESLDAAASTNVPEKTPSMSPFLSSSVPQRGGEFMHPKRSKTGDDYGPTDESLFEAKARPKPSREPSIKAVPKSPTQSSPEDPPTPSSMSNLRRKLSLSWKRNASKGQIAVPPGLVDKPPEYARQESMPPPMLPATAALANMGSTSKPGSPTTSAKASGTFLETRRRKSSVSSRNTVVTQDKTKGDTGGANAQSTKLPNAEISTERLTLSRNSPVMQKILKSKSSTATLRHPSMWTADLDKDDLVAEEEMRKMGSRRKETEVAARTLDALRKRATQKERVDPHEAIRIAVLNIYERGEIVDYPNIYFCGTQNARKIVGDLQSQKPNYGYDDDRGDYNIVPGDHLAYRYEVIDILGKGSFGQVVRCIDHCKGSLVAIKIIRNKKRFHQQALVEVNILKKLREWVSCTLYLVSLTAY